MENDRRDAGIATTYEELAPSIQTGDIFLFHGVGIVSKMIEFVQATPYSHSAVAVRHHDGEPPLLLHASAFSVVPDEAFDGRAHTGVQLGSLAGTLDAYAAVGKTAVYRRLHHRRTPDFDRTVADFIEETDGRHFPKFVGPVRWLEGRVLHVETGQQSFFCSQLVAMLYQRLGLLPDDVPANAYEPRDFSAANRELVLLGDASLGPEIDLVRR